MTPTQRTAAGTLTQCTLRTRTQKRVGEAVQAEDLSCETVCNSWQSGAFLFETVPCVLYILEKFSSTPEQAIIRAATDTKDNDTATSIVAAAMGALHGPAAFPPRWRNGLTGRTLHPPDEVDDGKIHKLIAAAKQCFWDSLAPQ